MRHCRAYIEGMSKTELKENQWICDTCGEVIERVKDGWFEWVSRRDDSGGKSTVSNFRIVHHIAASPRRGKGGCYRTPGANAKDDRANHLEQFVGPRGVDNLMDILEMNRIEDTEQFARVVRRLLIPGFERKLASRGDVDY